MSGDGWATIPGYSVEYSDGWQPIPGGEMTAWATFTGPGADRRFTLTARRDGSYSVSVRDAADDAEIDTAYAGGSGFPSIVHAMRDAVEVMQEHLGYQLRGLQP